MNPLFEYPGFSERIFWTRVLLDMISLSLDSMWYCVACMRPVAWRGIKFCSDQRGRLATTTYLRLRT